MQIRKLISQKNFDFLLRKLKFLLYLKKKKDGDTHKKYKDKIPIPFYDKELIYKQAFIKNEI